MGIPSGLVYDRINHKHKLGPRLVMVMGCICNFVGYFCFWNAATGRLGDSAPYWLVCSFAAVAGFGATWWDTTLVCTNVLNSPDEKGFVIGTLKSFVGLGAGVSTQVFKAYFVEEPLKFLLMLSIVPTAVAIVVLVFTNRVPYKQILKQRRTKKLYGVAVLTGIFIVTLVLSSTFVKSLNQGRGKIILTWTILSALLPMLSSPFFSGGWISQREHEEDDEDEEQQLLQSLSDPVSKKSEEEIGLDAGGLTFGETLKALDFWLIFICFGVVCGSGLTLLHNLGQLVPALTDGKQTNCTVFVQLFSLMNCCGRLGAGYLSQHLLTKRKVPRTLFVFLDCLMTAVNFIILLFTSIDTLYIPVLIGGFAFGANWSLVPTVISELFGAKAFASNYNFVQLASILGDSVLSTALAGHLYDLERKRQHHNGTECFGKVCFQKAFIVVAGIAFMSCIASLTLMMRTRKKYHQA